MSFCLKVMNKNIVGDIMAPVMNKVTSQTLYMF